MLTGQLNGGPDHGNLVESATRVIEARFTSELRLDGRPAQVVVTTGRYVWDSFRQVFNWELEGSKVITQIEFRNLITNGKYVL